MTSGAITSSTTPAGAHAAIGSNASPSETSSTAACETRIAPKRAMNTPEKRLAVIAAA